MKRASPTAVAVQIIVCRPVEPGAPAEGPLVPLVLLMSIGASYACDRVLAGFYFARVAPGMMALFLPGEETRNKTTLPSCLAVVVVVVVVDVCQPCIYSTITVHIHVPSQHARQRRTGSITARATRSELHTVYVSTVQFWHIYCNTSIRTVIHTTVI